MILFFFLIFTVKSSSLTPAASAELLRSSMLSAEKMRYNNEKMSGASGLDWIKATKPPFHDAYDSFQKCQPFFFYLFNRRIILLN